MATSRLSRRRTSATSTRRRIDSQFLTADHSQHGVRFQSIAAILEFLGVSPRYDQCIAYAPGAKNAPYCSRGINTCNRAKVDGLVRLLAATPVTDGDGEAFRLLEELSHCVVCGITGWHAPEARGIYDEWRSDLLQAYATVSSHNLLLRRSRPTETIAILRRAQRDEQLQIYHDASPQQALRSRISSSIERRRPLQDIGVNVPIPGSAIRASRQSHANPENRSDTRSLSDENITSIPRGETTDQALRAAESLNQELSSLRSQMDDLKRSLLEALGQLAAQMRQSREPRPRNDRLAEVLSQAVPGENSGGGMGPDPTAVTTGDIASDAETSGIESPPAIATPETSDNEEDETSDDEEEETSDDEDEETSDDEEEEADGEGEHQEELDNEIEDEADNEEG